MFTLGCIYGITDSNKPDKRKAISMVEMAN